LKKFSKILTLALALMMLTAMLAGCKAKNASGSESAKSEGSTQGTAASSAASDYEYIKNKGTMVIGITQYPPMNFYDKEGKLTGFDTEFAEAACENH